MRQLTILVLGIFCLEILLISLLIPVNWYHEIHQAQWLVDYELYGEEIMHQVTLLTHTYYDQLINQSGFKFSVTYFLIPTELEKIQSRGMYQLGNVWFDWVQNRIDAVFSALELGGYRLIMLSQWWPFFVLIICSAIVDGYLRYRIKLTDFSHVSPTLHRCCAKLICFLIGILWALLLWPMEISSWLLPCTVFLSALLMTGLLANFQKR